MTRAWLAFVIVVIIGIVFAFSANPSTLITPVQRLGVSTQIPNSRFKNGTAVSLTAPQVVKTGLSYTGDRSEDIGAIQTKDGFMLVIVPSSETAVFSQKNVKMTGTISTLDSKIPSHLSSTDQAYAAPMQLNYGSGWVTTVVFTWIGALAIILLALYFISRLVMLALPEYTRVYRRLVKKGSPMSVADLAAKLDEAAANGALTKVGKALYFCPEVTAFFAGAVGQLHQTSELIWVYPHVVRRRVYGVPAGANWSVVLCFADKRQVNATVKNEDQAKVEIQQLLGIYPNMLSGYSSDRAAKFKTGDIDALRAELQNQPPRPVVPPTPTGPRPDAPPHDPALLSGMPPSAAVASDTPYEQNQRYYGRGGMLTSKTDKQTRKDIKAIKAARKAAGEPKEKKRRRGEFDTRDVSAPPSGMQASAPKEATAPSEESSFGLSDDEFGGDFK